MQKNILKITQTITIIALMACGCGHIPAGFSSSVSPISEKNETTVIKHSTGSQTYFSLFGFLPFGRPNYDKAIKDALSSAPEGKNLINARSWYSSTWLILGTVYTLHIEGDVVK